MKDLGAALMMSGILQNLKTVPTEDQLRDSLQRPTLQEMIVWAALEWILDDDFKILSTHSGCYNASNWRPQATL